MNNNMNLQEKSKQLFDLRQKIADVEKVYREAVDPIKAQRDTIQLEVLDEFKNLGTFSMRYDFATVSLAVRKTPKVTDEKRVMAVLKKKKLAKEYIAPRLTDLFYDNLGKIMAEGNEIDGVEIQQTEYLSISTAKQGDKRKVVTE